MTAPTNRPRAGAGYRLLRKGEIIRRGDQIMMEKWTDLSEGGIIGDRVFLAVMRRRTSGPTKEINYQTLSLSMYKAKSLKEARAIYEKKVGKK